MMAFAMLLIGSSLVVNVADTVPRYDMKPTCRAAVAMMGNQGRTVESCMRRGKGSQRSQKDWSKYPSAEQTQCAAPMANNRSPSYVELLICLEMMGDPRKHRDEEQAASKSKKQLASLSRPGTAGADRGRTGTSGRQGRTDRPAIIYNPKLTMEANVLDQAVQCAITGSPATYLVFPKSARRNLCPFNKRREFSTRSPDVLANGSRNPLQQSLVRARRCRRTSK